MDTHEFKSFALELKDGVDESGLFDGHAAVFGNVDLGGDVIEPGAFSKTIADNSGEVPILWQHNPYEPIGVGKIAEDGKGLAVKGQLNMEVQRAREARALMRQKALKGLSIGYRAVKFGFEDGPQGSPFKRIRRLKEIAMREFSPVTFPMNPSATYGAVKGIVAEIDSLDDLELVLNAIAGLAQNDEKAGRVLSGANTDKVRAALAALQALLDSAASSGPGKGAAALSDEPDDSTRRALLDAVKTEFVLAEIRGARSLFDR